MKLFRKKSEESQVEEVTYEIFGGFTITEKPGSYEIMWRNPNLTVVTVDSRPIIDEGIQIRHEGNVTHGISHECRIRITMKEGKKEAHISKI